MRAAPAALAALLVAVLCFALVAQARARPPLRPARAWMDLPTARVIAVRGRSPRQIILTAARFVAEFDQPLFVEQFNGSLSYVALADAQRVADGLGSVFELRCGQRTYAAAGAGRPRLLDASEGTVLPLSWGLVPAWEPDNELHAGAATVATAFRALNDTAGRPGRSLTFLLLLHYADDAGQSLESDVVPAVPVPALRQAALATAFSNCTLRMLPREQQAGWPLLRVTDGLARRTVREVGPFQLRMDAVLPTLHVDGQPGRAAASTHHRAHMHHYPTVSQSWHHVVPPMPDYCGLREGALSLAQVETLQAAHETAFIESQFPIPGLQDILDFAMKILMPPIMDPFMDLLGEHAVHTVAAQTGHDVMENVPRDTVKLLEPALRYNLTNLLTDSVTAALTRSVTEAITMDLGPAMAEKLVDALADSLHHRIEPVLTEAIPDRINLVTPYLLERSLPITLTNQLTRAVAHALVPTLTHALTHTPQQEYWCYMCYYHHSHCSFCHDSPESQYYTSYYSTYYADYYSAYYAKYYVSSLREIDKAQHPAGQQEAARKQNLNEHNREGTERAVTPDGLP